MPLVVFGGKEYGTGSSRDWAAKGTMLLGVKAVIVESFERIHRSNLVGMGVLPLTFKDGMDRKTLGPDRRGDASTSSAWTTSRRGWTCRWSSTAPNGTTDTVPVICRDRYAGRGRLLPARRHPALRAARDGEGGLITRGGPARFRTGPFP